MEIGGYATYDNLLRVEQAFYHLVNLTVHSGKVAVEHDFLLAGILEGIDFGEVNVL